MLRFKLRQLIAEYEFKHQRRLTLGELSAATGIYRTTLSRIASPVPHNTTTDNIELLCAFFGCRVEELLEYVPDKPKDAEGTVR